MALEHVYTGGFNSMPIKLIAAVDDSLREEMTDILITTLSQFQSMSSGAFIFRQLDELSRSTSNDC